jgi:hypothetical protein
LENVDGRVRAIASSAVSKIASYDFPEQWPDLLDILLQVISAGSDGQVHGALKVLADLVDEGLGDRQFFQSAKHLVQVAFDVAVADARPPTLRALAVSVFRDCLDSLESFLEDEHKEQVKEFAEQILQQWIPFLLHIVQASLPEPPSEQEERVKTPNAELFKGSVTLKLQVLKVCSVFCLLLIY